MNRFHKSETGVNNITVYDPDLVVDFAPWNSPTFDCATEIDLCLSDHGALSSTRCQEGNLLVQSF